MQRNRSRATFVPLAAAWCLAGALFALPHEWSVRLQTWIVDAGSPARVAIRSAVQRAQPWVDSVASRITIEPTVLPSPDNASSVYSSAELDEVRRRCRAIEIENARLKQEWQLAETYGVSPVLAPDRTDRRTATGVRAELFGGAANVDARSRAFLDRGAASKLGRSMLVLDESKLHVDCGSGAGIEPSAEVFVGRCVVGRIAAVGATTSSIDLITDSAYRGLAQVVRPSDQGAAFQATGILAGRGDGFCKLTDIPTTETLRVGDEVYTSDRDEQTPVSLYYGTIVAVYAAGRHWEVTVKPAVDVGAIKSVCVLRVESAAGSILAD